MQYNLYTEWAIAENGEKIERSGSYIMIPMDNWDIGILLKSPEGEIYRFVVKDKSKKKKPISKKQ